MEAIMSGTNNIPVDMIAYAILQRAIYANFSDQMDNVKCGCDRVSNLNVSQVKVYFYNYATGGQENWAYIDQAADSIFAANFDKSQCFNIFILGFNTAIDTSIPDDVRSTFSKIQCNNMMTYGVIIDHYAYTKFVNNDSYVVAVRYTKSIGQAIGTFIAQLLSKVNIDNINVIGHSLGAHMLGYAGEVVKQEIEPLKVIYTADAASPCYVDCPNEHVRAGQAELVINIHCTDTLGTKLRTGDYDFVSHDGVTQRGCESFDDELTASCSHNKCVQISLIPANRDDIWQSKRCDSYAEFNTGNCNGHDTTLAGYTRVPNQATTKGIYFFEPDICFFCFPFSFPYIEG